MTQAITYTIPSNVNPNLFNSKISFSDKIWCFIESNYLEDQLILITAIALTALLGIVIMATGTAPLLGCVVFCMAIGGTIGLSKGAINSRKIRTNIWKKDQVNDLHVAIIKQKYYWLKCALVDAKIDVNQKSLTGFTPLHLSVEKQNEVALLILLQNKQVKKAINERIKASSESVFSNLNDALTLMEGNDPTKTPTALYLAAEKADLNMVKILLAHGADPKAGDYYGNDLDEAVKKYDEIDVKNGLVATRKPISDFLVTVMGGGALSSRLLRPIKRLFSQ